MAVYRCVLGTVIALGFLSCTTVPNVSPPPIQVPAGLAASDVELAILIAVADPPEPPDLNPGQQITVNVLNAIVGTQHSADRHRQPWFFEAREVGAVIAGFQRGQFYMRVKVRFDEREITLTIVESRNLSQTGDLIHRGAFSRLQTLENRIRRALGEIVHRNTYGGNLN